MDQLVCSSNTLFFRYHQIVYNLNLLHYHKLDLDKFLDLEIFDRKFKMAKEECSDTRGALRRLEGTDFDALISEARAVLKENQERLETNQQRCAELDLEISSLKGEVLEIDNKVDSAPTEIIDPIKIKMEIETRSGNIGQIKEDKEND